MPFFEPAEVPESVFKPDAVAFLNEIYAKLNGRVIDEIPIRGPTLAVRITAQTKCFLQAHIRRALMFAEAAREEYHARRGLVSLACVRSIYESIALIWEFESKLSPLLAAGNVQDVVDFVHNRTFATRITKHLEAAPQVAAPNILNAIDFLTKTCPHARDDYDRLSEVVHPNSMGAYVYFETGSRDGTTKFSSEGTRDYQLVSILIAASLFMYVITALDKLEPALNEFSKIPDK